MNGFFSNIRTHSGPTGVCTRKCLPATAWVSRQTECTHTFSYLPSASLPVETVIGALAPDPKAAACERHVTINQLPERYQRPGTPAGLGNQGSSRHPPLPAQPPSVSYFPFNTLHASLLFPQPLLPHLSSTLLLSTAASTLGRKEK